jgi:hypothetical protein
MLLELLDHREELFFGVIAARLAAMDAHIWADLGALSRVCRRLRDVVIALPEWQHRCNLSPSLRQIATMSTLQGGNITLRYFNDKLVAYILYGTPDNRIRSPQYNDPEQIYSVYSYDAGSYLLIFESLSKYEVEYNEEVDDQVYITIRGDIPVWAHRYADDNVISIYKYNSRLFDDADEHLHERVSLI